MQKTSTRYDRTSVTKMIETRLITGCRELAGHDLQEMQISPLSAKVRTIYISPRGTKPAVA